MTLLESWLDSQIRNLVPTLPGWCTVEKALEMSACVVRNRPQICVEIGVFGGRSWLPVALACKSNQQGHAFGVDAWSARQSLDKLDHADDIAYWSELDYDAIRLGCMQAIEDARLSEYCTPIQLSSSQCSDLFSRIDFLHIDGNHSSNRALQDVRLFLPKVAIGGDIWFDDANWPSTQQAVQLLRESCDVICDYESYLHLRKRAPSAATAIVPSISPEVVRTLQDRRRILDLPAGNSDGYHGGTYNPGAAVWGGRSVLLARNERYTELERRGNPTLWRRSCRPLLIELDRSGTVASLKPLRIPNEAQDDRSEDFRLFVWQSRLMTSFSRVMNADRIEIQVAHVDIARSQIDEPIRPQLDFTVAPIEKNWAFFEIGNQLYMIYSFQPFRLLKLVDENTFDLRTVIVAPIGFYGQSHPIRFSPQISLSTSPIEFRGDLIVFVHHRDAASNYQHFAVWLNRESLHPFRISRSPVFSGGEARGMRPGVLYLSAVIRFDGEYRFYFGEGDEHTSYLALSEIELGELLADSIAIGLDPDMASEFAGWYQYEHAGLFQRMVFLEPDGSIRNGGDHDSHWNVVHLNGRKEVRILGSGEISCRMEQTEHDRWTGVWNRGTRPLATLTRDRRHEPLRG